MIILLVVTGIALGCGLMGSIVGIMIDRWRRESRQLDTDIAEYEHRGRHAKTQPRTAPSRNPATGTWHLPIPGPPKPQAGRDSGPGTVTFGKVDAGATGPIAKLVADNEAWNAQQAVEDEIFRLGLALD